MGHFCTVSEVSQDLDFYIYFQVFESVLKRNLHSHIAHSILKATPTKSAIGNSSGSKLSCLAKTCVAKISLEMPQNILETPKNAKEENLHEGTKFQCESCDLSYVSNLLLESHVEKFHLGKNLFRMIDPDQFWVDRK